MPSKNNQFSFYRTHLSCLHVILLFTVAILFSACAHPITINPSSTPQRSDKDSFSTKIAGYVMTDEDRAKQVTTGGGGGDNVSYFPYKDLEKGIRDALKSLYMDVMIVRSSTDFESIKRDGIGIIFASKIDTTSSSDSIFTWPPTQFSIELSSNVTDVDGKIIATLRATGKGDASFSEFKEDFGLAGRRAAQDMLEKFIDQIRANPQLR
jgi:hypothetical protein